MMEYYIEFKRTKTMYDRFSIKMIVYANNTQWYIINFLKTNDVFISDYIFISDQFAEFKKFLIENDFAILYPKYVKQRIAENFYIFQLTTKSLLLAL